MPVAESRGERAVGTDASVLEDALPEEVVGHARPELREHAACGVVPQPPRVDPLELRLHRLDDCHVRVVVLQPQQPLSFGRQPLSLAAMSIGRTGKSMQKADCREPTASSSFQFHSSKPSSVAAATSVGVRSSQLLSQMTATPPSHASALPQPSRIAVSTCALSSSLHDSCFAATSSSAPSGAAAGRWRVSTMTTPSASWSMCWRMRRGRAGSLGPRRWVEYLSTQPAWLSHARKRCAHRARSVRFARRQLVSHGSAVPNSPLATINLGGRGRRGLGVAPGAGRVSVARRAWRGAWRCRVIPPRSGQRPASTLPPQHAYPSGRAATPPLGCLPPAPARARRAARRPATPPPPLGAGWGGTSRRSSGAAGAPCQQRYRCHLEQNATQTPAISWHLTCRGVLASSSWRSRGGRARGEGRRTSPPPRSPPGAPTCVKTIGETIVAEQRGQIETSGAKHDRWLGQMRRE